MTPPTPKPTELVASVSTTRVGGQFFRHAALGRDAFTGGFGGRWGATFPVIYLASPVDAVVVEAYRHLVEDAGVPAASVQPRALYTVSVDATDILDLTDQEALLAVGLSQLDLQSAVGDYAGCQRIAAAAHQLQRHGVLAPSATGFGNTLALFRDRLPAGELPAAVTHEVWETLPLDPRILRIVGSAAMEPTGS